MADITMCEGGDCPQRETCYRFKARASTHWHAYFLAPPVKPDQTCDHYWPIAGGQDTATGGVLPVVKREE